MNDNEAEDEAPDNTINNPLWVAWDTDGNVEYGRTKADALFRYNEYFGTDTDGDMRCIQTEVDLPRPRNVEFIINIPDEDGNFIERATQEAAS